MKQIINSTNPSITVTLWGILGGLSLIFIAGRSHNGAPVITIFGITLVLALITAKLNRPGKIFLDLFFITLLTFIVMMTIDYIYIITTINPRMLEVPLIGHLWRIGALLGIGTVVSLVLTLLATLRK